jgi:hypothetical protein
MNPLLYKFATVSGNFAEHTEGYFNFNRLIELKSNNASYKLNKKIDD